MQGKLSWFWALAALFLTVSIVGGGIVLWSRRSQQTPIEISNSQPPQWQGQIYVGGAVNRPGFYPLEAGDSIDSLLRAAGSANTSADMNKLELLVPAAGGEPAAQKIDVNRADTWLLDALPGIGETLAQRIVDFRKQNGPFRNTDELRKVPGIGDSVYSGIKDLITVSDQ